MAEEVARRTSKEVNLYGINIETNHVCEIREHSVRSHHLKRL